MFHPADTNTDNVINLSELDDFIILWKDGNTTIDLTVNAAAIQINGEEYEFNMEKSPPFCIKQAPDCPDPLPLNTDVDLSFELTGNNVNFTRNSSSDIDEITDTVHLTRNNSGPVYNILEGGPTNSRTTTDPKGTFWSVGTENSTTFRFRTLWETIGGRPGGSPGIENTDMIMYIPAENKFFQITFSNWEERGGGDFSYTRKELELVDCP